MYVLRILFEAKGSRSQGAARVGLLYEGGQTGSEGSNKASGGASLMGITVSEQGRQSWVLVMGPSDSPCMAKR